MAFSVITAYYGRNNGCYSSIIAAKTRAFNAGLFTVIKINASNISINITCNTSVYTCVTNKIHNK